MLAVSDQRVCALGQQKDHAFVIPAYQRAMLRVSNALQAPVSPSLSCKQACLSRTGVPGVHCLQAMWCAVPHACLPTFILNLIQASVD